MMIRCLNYKVCALWDGSFRLISFLRMTFRMASKPKMRENAGDRPYVLVLNLFYCSQFSSSASHANSRPLVVIFGPASCNLQPLAAVTNHWKLPDQASRLPDLHGVKRFAPHAGRPVVCNGGAEFAELWIPAASQTRGQNIFLSPLWNNCKPPKLIRKNVVFYVPSK